MWKAVQEAKKKLEAAKETARLASVSTITEASKQICIESTKSLTKSASKTNVGRINETNMW